MFNLLCSNALLGNLISEVILLKIEDCIIVGGGIAGLQAAIQLGRYLHKVVVIDSNQGRSTLCKCYHNILGWPDGISGEDLRKLGKKHAEKYGVIFMKDKVKSLKKEADIFQIITEKNSMFQAKTIFLATGLVDHLPKVKHLTDFLGTFIYVCPDCDGYEVSGKKTVVLGSGNAGANMAITLSYWTNDLIFVNHDKAEVDSKKLKNLVDHNIKFINEPIEEIIYQENRFLGVLLKNNEIIEAERGFIAFGGNKLNNELAEQVGITLSQNKHVLVNPRTKQTNVDGVWAGGDLAVHSEQVTIAMGDGSQAAIWIHKKLISQDNK